MAFVAVTIAPVSTVAPARAVFESIIAKPAGAAWTTWPESAADSAAALVVTPWPVKWKEERVGERRHRKGVTVTGH